MIIAGIVHAHPAAASDFDAADAYMQRLKVSQSVSPAGANPFGESVNPYTGELSFHHVDVVLEGAGPSIVVGRKTLTSQDATYSANTEMGGWDLTIPRIETLLVAPPASSLTYEDSIGMWWRTTLTAQLYSRCSQLANTARSPKSTGIHLFDENGQSREILIRGASNTAQPTPSLTGISGAPGVTLDNWQIACLPSTSNGEIGEAFLAIAPDGTKYWFNHLIGYGVESPEPESPGMLPVTQLYSSAWQMLDYWKGYFGLNGRISSNMTDSWRHSLSIQPTQMIDGGQLQHGRSVGAMKLMGVMYATRVEDRFGNAINYTYMDGRISSITATDGRNVQFEWSAALNRVIKVKVYPGTASERVWSYEYKDPPTAAIPHLSKVTRPDGSAWELSRTPITGNGYVPLPCGLYSIPGLSNDSIPQTLQVIVKNPQGATGVFGLGSVYHQRSNVTYECRPADSMYSETEVREAPLFVTASVLSETISGPGIAAQTWSFTYAPAKIEYCANNVNCAGGPQNSPKWVDITDPDGNRTRRYYDNKKGWAEGKLVKEEFYQGSSNLLRSIATIYAYPNSGPWPVTIGTALRSHTTYNALDMLKSETISPVLSVETAELDQKFSMVVNEFDAFARPIRVTRGNVPAPPPLPPSGPSYPPPPVCDTCMEP
jgi:hypothetical protein